MTTRQALAIGWLAVLSATVLCDAALAGDDHRGRGLSVSKFEGFIHFCAESVIESEEVSPDGILMLVARNIGNIWDTGNPLLDGREENRVEATIDLVAGIGEARIRGKLEPGAVDGRWYFQQQLTIDFAEGDSSRGIGFGTGDLRGRLMLFRTGSFVMAPNSPCPENPSVPLEGRIIGHGWAL